MVEFLVGVRDFTLSEMYICNATVLLVCIWFIISVET